MFERSFRIALMRDIYRSPASNIELKRFFQHSRAYSVNVVNQDVVEIEFDNLFNATGSYVYDATRFASAMLQTIAAIKQNVSHDNLTSWLQIQSYYSSYFSAHALIRLTGVSCTNFDPEDFEKMNKLAVTTNQISRTNLIKSGYFTVKIISATKIQLTRSNDRSHVFVWREFGKVLNEFLVSAQSNAILSEEEKAEALFVVNGILDLIRIGNEDYSWLSKRRNDVNYRLPLTLWYPFKKPNTNIEKAMRIVDFSARDIYSPSSTHYDSEDTRSLAAISNINKIVFLIMKDIHSVIGKRNSTVDGFNIIYRDFYEDSFN